MAKEQALTVSLEEFGLSRYEARAYVALITKGTVSASELAYYAEIPRTKAYQTLRKLEKKRLVMLSKSQPVMCTAVSPEDAFDEAIHEQIDRVNAMNTLVSGLKQASEASKRSRGDEEQRYLHIAANGVLDRIRRMIDGSKESIHMTADQWGLGLISECREQLVGASRRGLDVKVIIGPSQIGSEHFRRIPDGVRVRAAEGCQNCLVFDDSEMLVVDSGDGRAAVFSSAGILCAVQNRLFAHAWRSAIRTESMADMTKSESQEICRMIRAMDDDGLGHILGTAYAGHNKEPAMMLEFLAKNGVDLGGKTIDDVIEIVDSALQIRCSGHANLDMKNHNISIESRLNSGHSLPWAGILDEYLRGRGYKTRMTYQNSSQKGERVHIKITGRP